MDAAVPPSTWGLTAEGYRQAAELVSSPWLEDVAVLAAGPEPKMVESLRPTAEMLGVDVVIDDTFRETDARWLPDEGFLASVDRLFASPTSSPAAGWERSRDAGRRVLAGLMRISRSAPGDGIAVCSGGRALTSLLVELGTISPEHAFAHWQSIGTPDFAVLEMPASGPAVMIRHFADDR